MGVGPSATARTLPTGALPDGPVARHRAPSRRAVNQDKENTMTDDVLARDLRDALNTANVGMSDAMIDQAIVGQLREDGIAMTQQAPVARLLANKAAFANALDQTLLMRGAAWNQRVYDLVQLNLSPGIQLVATEELTAIRTWSPTPRFDAAKALTNMLRIIKAAER
jgi:hypothetical protein